MKHEHLFVLVGIGALFLVRPAFSDPFDAVVDAVKEMCSRPAESGKIAKVTAKGEGNVSVTLKSLPSAELGGELNFTKGEWEGVQTVLQEQVAGDSADYRACVRDLTPRFLEKIPDSPTGQVPAPSPQFAGRWDSSNGPYWIVRPSARKDEYKIEKYTALGRQIGEGKGSYSDGVFSFYLDQNNYEENGTLHLIAQKVEGQLTLSGEKLVGSTDQLSNAEWNEFLTAVGEEPLDEEPGYVSEIVLTRH